MFPTEIWEKILHNIDAAYLVPLKSVSCTWNTIINKHLKESDAWYRSCKKHIPEKYWLMLLENSIHLTTLQKQRNNIDDYDKFSYKIWLTMYRAWTKWQNVHNYNIHTIDEFHPIPNHRPSERITCCSVLGELLVIGTTEGYIRIFNLRTCKLVFRVDQYEHVVDVKLCVQGKNYDKIVLVATSVFNKSRLWDVTDQKQLMTTSGDVICAGYGYYCTTVCHDNILIYNAKADDCFPTRLFIKDVNNSRSSSRQYKSKPRIMKYTNMIINNHQLCFLSDNGLYCELELREVIQAPRYLYTPDIHHIGTPKNQKVCRYYLYNPYVAFCVTEMGQLGISVHKSKWQMYNVFPFFEGLVTSILFYVRVLVIGLDSGDLVLYSIENETALKNIDFKSKKSKRISVASEPIISVNIMEISGDQRLIVTTKNTVFHIQFDCITN